MTHADTFPTVRNVGLDGILVTFSDAMTEPSNRAALAFRSVVEDQYWDGIVETSTSLASTYLRFDTSCTKHSDIEQLIRHTLSGRDWYTAPLPSGRKLWRVPTVYGTDLAPQLDEAAAAAGMSSAEAIRKLSQTQVRVLTIGFAPGQPYLGPLAPEFNIPRLQELNPMVQKVRWLWLFHSLFFFPGQHLPDGVT